MTVRRRQRRTKVCGSATYLTDKSSRAARPSKARRIGFIFSLTHLPEKFFVRAQERSRSWRNFFQKVSRTKNNYAKLHICINRLHRRFDQRVEKAGKILADAVGGLLDLLVRERLTAHACGEV